MSIKKGDILELRVEKMAAGGMGIARLDGYVVFVKGGVPGDKVKARVYKKKKDYSEAKVLEVISPSEYRAETGCQYCGYCGGCQWQHIKYDAQLAYKREIVKEALAKIGGLDNIPVMDTIPSPELFGYRNKMEFTFSNRPWLMPSQLEDNPERPPFALGLHIPGSFNRVIDIESCLLQPDNGNAILDIAREYVRKTQIPVYDMKSHQGFWRFLMLRNSKAFGDWMVNIVTSDDAPQVLMPLADEICRRIKGVRTVVNNVTRKKAAVAVGDNELVLMGEGFIEEGIGGFRFRISANSFFQTNSKAAENLYTKVREYAGLSGREDVLDLYSGTGTIPIFISREAKQILGIEISRDGVIDAKNNCKINNIDNCEFVVGDIKEIIPKIAFKADVIVIDPPRPGMHKEVTKMVLNMAARKIVYVSCNPATMARDLGYISQDYEIKEIQPVDMFPHTHHIEAVAKCVKK